MAFLGLFGNYDKPGPGVDKDEPKKAAPVRFFEILWRKLSKLVQLNLTFMIPFIVVIALMVGVFLLPVPHFLYVTSFFGVLDLYILYAVTLPLILLSPFTCGLAYVTRNFAREEHAFVWSDFWDAVKNNWKPALLNGVIVYLAYVILSFSIFFYSTRVSDNWMFMIPLAVCCILSILMLFAQYYIPVMIVTFDLKLRHMYRNAFIFSIMGLLRRPFPHSGKWVGVYGFLQLLAGGVRVDFCSAEIFMAQNILQNANIHVAVLVHQRRRRVPQLVYGVSRAAKPNFREVFIDHGLYGLRTDACAAVADEQRVFILHVVLWAHTHVGIDRS